MMNVYRWIAAASLAICTIQIGTLAIARELVTPGDFYSAGVHAYFAGRYDEAAAFHSNAIELAYNDPRPYYFRALSLMNLGHTAQARDDMAIGAALEAGRSNRYPVGTALQHIQGSQRLLLEKYRRSARSNASLAQSEIARQHHEQMSPSDNAALRQRVIIPLDELLRLGGPRPLSAEEVARRAVAARRPRPAVVETPAPTPPQSAVPETNPFADDATPPNAEPDGPGPAATMPEATETEIESTGDDSEENPFGDF
jgi:hypothetical protein